MDLKITSLEDGTYMLENATILWPNFSGKETKYNAAGEKNFSVILDEDTAAAMLRDGWNVKRRKPRDEDYDEIGDPHIEVKVNYGGGRPPRIVMLTSRGRTDLTEELVEILDAVEIISADLIVRPYRWEVRGQGGIKAYLKTLYVRILEDPLDLKYADEVKGDG